jgi:hypothetical protein
MIVRKFWLVFDRLLKISLIIQQPSEQRLLNFLVVLLLEEIIMDELHRSKDNQFTSFETNIESTYRSMSGETNRTTTQNWRARFTHIQGRAIWIYEL